ncbi:hypothetical protein FACS18949_15990 [Clostridia bacterium]|nr:hypothetical protein FACS18949_15990 [Clostridia bacterium]
MNNVAVIFLEILVTGVTASIWIALMVVKILYPGFEIEKLSILINSISIGNALVYSICIYNLGWVMHHIAEKILDPIFQTRYRRKLFEDKIFFEIRSFVFQFGSQSVMDDIKFDRHLLRISRSNVINFFALALIAVMYIPISVNVFLLTSIIATIFCLVSFLQWKSRYQATFKKFSQMYDAINFKMTRDNRICDEGSLKAGKEAIDAQQQYVPTTSIKSVKSPRNPNSKNKKKRK